MKKSIVLTNSNYSKAVPVEGKGHVYLVHARRPHPRAIGKSSVIYIGRSGTDETRMRGWFSSPDKHHAAWTLYWWSKELRNVIGLPKIIDIPLTRAASANPAKIKKLWDAIAEQLVVVAYPSLDAAKDETYALHQFWMCHGEPPLLNSCIGKRWDHHDDAYFKGMKLPASFFKRPK